MNFALIMLIALLITGGVWLYDKLIGEKGRASGAKEPMVVEYSKSFFPVILAVFMLRSFLVEPFKIPSGSMMSTLLVGDFILVNKYTYGVRLPVANVKILEVNHPKNGDVMVFRYPRDPSLDYIKRVVGVPGDVVDYRNKHLSINGKPLPMKEQGSYSYVASGLNYISATLYRETLGEHVHDTLVQPEAPSVYPNQVDSQFPYRWATTAIAVTIAVIGALCRIATLSAKRS
jgi:signal peptidase I